MLRSDTNYPDTLWWADQSSPALAWTARVLGEIYPEDLEELRSRDE